MVPRSRAAGDTDPGLQREQNEDRFFFDEAKGVYCVIDGVGGHNAGERAAAIAADVLRASMARTSEADLRAAFARASDAIYEAASGDPALSGMACVVSLAAISDGRVRFAHVGDTRLYKLRGGTITKLTRDQSPVGELEDSGALTETEAMRHPRRNEIYKDLGSRPPGPEVAASILTGEVAFEPDAALLLCSDGLTDQVSSGSIRRIVEAFAGSPALAVQELLTAANDAGGKDNVTVVIVEGERFAGAVTPRGPRRAGAPAAPAGEPVTGASRRPVAVPPAAARPTGSRPARTRWWSAGLGLVAGLILGAGGVVAARTLGWDLERLWSRAPAVTGPRTWVVGLEPSADFSNIGEALAKAAAGDTVTVGPGEYREAVTLKSGVQLVGSRDSLLKPPVGAAGDWTAVTARGVTDARLSGFVIGAGPGQPLADRPAGRGRDHRRGRTGDLRRARRRRRPARRRPGDAEQQPDPRQRRPRRHRAGAGGTAPRAQRHHPQRTRAAEAGRRRRRGGRGARARRQRHRRQRRRGGAGLAGSDAAGAGAAQRAVAGARARRRRRYRRGRHGRRRRRRGPGRAPGQGGNDGGRARRLPPCRSCSAAA